MDLLLPFTVIPSAEKISYRDKVLFIGSCFSEEIGKQMHSLKFNVLQNPNGMLYDPISISFALNSYIENKIFNGHDLFILNDLWHSWQHHSIFSQIKKEDTLEQINHSQCMANEFLKTASWLIITPGTAYSYRLKKSGMPVANCHKAPQDFFEKKLLPADEIIANLSDSILKLQSYNSNLNIVFTISPVRHVRDGVVENNRSKARLIEAVHFIKEKFQKVFYFPAYELIIDVLRDYRFYKDDLVHPSGAATNFVFELFCETFINKPGIKLMKEIKGIIKASKHRPFQKDSEGYKKFMNAQFEKIKNIKKDFPSIDFSSEENLFLDVNL